MLTWRWRSRLVLERQRNLGAEGDDLSAFDLHVELVDFRDAQIAQRRGGRLDGGLRGVLPGGRTRADDLRDAIDTRISSLLGHVELLMLRFAGAAQPSPKHHRLGNASRTSGGAPIGEDRDRVRLWFGGEPDQLLRLRRLREMGMEASTLRRVDIRGPAHSGQSDQTERPRPRFALQGASELDAAHPGHVEIQKGDRGLELARHLQAFVAVEARADVEAVE